MTNTGKRKEVRKGMLLSERMQQRLIAGEEEDLMEVTASLHYIEQFLGKALDYVQGCRRSVVAVQAKRQRRRNLSVIEGGRGQRQSEGAPEPPRAA